MRKKFEILFDVGNILGICILTFALVTGEMEISYLGVCIFFISELFQFINNFIDRQNSRDLKFDEEAKFEKLDFNKLWEIFAYMSVVVALIANLKGGYYARGVNEDEKIILQIVSLLIVIILIKIYYFFGFKFRLFHDGIIYSNGEWISYNDVSEVVVFKRFFRLKKRVTLTISENKRKDLLYKNYNMHLKDEEIKLIVDTFQKDTN